MTLQASYVKSLFADLENGKSGAFFEHVADDVNWTVMGTHPLAGTYHTKADFLAHTFARLDKILEEGVVLRVTNILVDGADRKSTRLNSSHANISYAVFCLKKTTL